MDKQPHFNEHHLNNINVIFSAVAINLLLSVVTAAPISLHTFLLFSEGDDTIKSSALHIPFQKIINISYYIIFITKHGSFNK